MTTLRSRLRALAAWIDGRETRERAMLLAAALAIAIGAWTAFVWDPLAARRSETAARADVIEEEVRALERQAAEILAASERDPDAELHARSESLRSQLASLDLRIRDHTSAMIAPDEMPRFLERLLREQRQLELVRLENLGAEPVFPRATEAEPPSALYRHTFEIELRGDYLGTLRYLRALEALPWRFYWEALEYRVESHPLGVARIRAWTLGTGEGWVGV